MKDEKQIYMAQESEKWKDAIYEGNDIPDDPSIHY